ncbi:MAG: potassium-transporting ATPase subunit KdpC [Verrucomicrobiae bacterium]|nr:potassium-transporting ATPase subunit KdpC [Verrucomicrobiae bacterium]
MNTLWNHLRASIFATLILAVVCCGAYPLIVWGAAKVLFPRQAEGSLIVDNTGVVCGSGLIGQGFTKPFYFHSRPSAAGNGYDATSSGGSNLGPTSQKLRDAIKDRVAAYRSENGLKDDEPVPADAVTASASGLDPHISPRNAELQLARVSRARGLDAKVVRDLISRNTDEPDFKLLGEPGVNVLTLNQALDQIAGRGPPKPEFH